MANMENLKLGTKVILTNDAKRDTYSDMNWKDDILIITYKEDDNEGMGKLYSFESASSNKEITCSPYGYELKLA